MVLGVRGALFWAADRLEIGIGSEVNRCLDSRKNAKKLLFLGSARSTFW
jgi:hypothetical protein